MDLQAEPRGSQMMLSIHADGTVVVWLGGLMHPPFNEKPAREELRTLLNEMDGVHIHSRQVNGWPRFPIERLEDPVNLLKLVAVLDRIAEESHTIASPGADRQDDSPALDGTITEQATASDGG